MLHRSLCHANYQAMQRVASSDVKGMEKGAKEKVKACPGCREGKATKQPKPTVVDKRNVTFNPEVRGYGNKGCTATDLAKWTRGPAMVPVTNLFGNADRADPSFSRPLFNDPPSQPSFEEGQEGKEVVFEVVTPLQEQGRGPARAVQGHNAVGRSVGVDIPILSPQLPTAQLESTLTFPETTVNEQAVGQAVGQAAAPNNYGKQLARNDIAGDIVQSAIIHGPRARRPTPITHPSHLAVEERTGDNQETSDIANFALFTRVIQKPAKKARDHPLVYAAQKEEVDGWYKMGTLTWCALDSCIFYLSPACIDNSFPDPEARSSRLPLWLVLRTDDILVFCFNKEQSDNLEHEFRKTFNLTNLGEVRVFCGLEFYRDTRGIVIHQHTYCKGILEDFGFNNPKPSRVLGTTANVAPMPENAPLRKFALPSLTGSLTWPATQTRPDIAFDVNNASVTAMCSRILRY
eukprot:g77104.t1